jgi:hypothetical protein
VSSVDDVLVNAAGAVLARVGVTPLAANYGKAAVEKTPPALAPAG